MKIFVGTSGWYYDWNLKKSLDWYIANSGLDAVELNASFYRFPFPNQIKSWVKKGKNIRWSVKVNKFITHIYKFNQNALKTWKKFAKLFEPLNHLIDFYLFQLPPSTNVKSVKRIEEFIKKTKLKERFALEVRNEEWFKEKYVRWAENLGLTWVSIDSPEPRFPRDVYNTSSIVYERIHGRTSWYSHNYSKKELIEIAEKIKKAKSKKAYIFFNNNHAMLENAREMKKVISKVV